MSFKVILIIITFFTSPMICSAQDHGKGFNTLDAVKMSLHKENYLLPYYHNTPRPLDASDSEELKYQISVKMSLVGDGHQSLSFAYTQKSFWQLYNAIRSRPFREHNYNPEIFLRLGGASIFGDLGYEHESNGKDDPKSRSWDRVYLKIFLRTVGLKVYAKYWYSFFEESSGADDEERPAPMATYYGRGEIGLGVKVGPIILKAYGRLNFNNNHGFLESKVLFPLGKDLYFALVYANGYGDSLRSYSENIQSFGVGILKNP